ncbi:hypothetical protein KY284_032701 [Solanum tuberosum]|nr:hypothetical protein KY284_032701 [Solanum tuberosum]
MDHSNRRAANRHKISSLPPSNKSTLLNWLWRFGQNEAGYRRDVIKSKHGILDHWRPMTSKGAHGNGHKIRLGKDKRLGDTTLKESFPYAIPDSH